MITRYALTFAAGALAGAGAVFLWIASRIVEEDAGPECSKEGCHRPATHAIRAGVPVLAEGRDRAFCAEHSLWP